MKKMTKIAMFFIAIALVSMVSYNLDLLNVYWATIFAQIGFGGALATPVVYVCLPASKKKRAKKGTPATRCNG